MSFCLGCLLSCERQGPRHLVFISLDTVRKDHLSTYGYPRETTPNIDRLAARGAVFENGVAQATITNPSHTSMFTGLYPFTHRVGENAQVLAGDYETLAEILQRAGYRTGAFVSGFPLRERVTTIDRGFEVYDSNFNHRREGRISAGLARNWLRQRQPQERFFLFLHLYDAHGPFQPPARYRGTFHSEEPGPLLTDLPGYQKIKNKDGDVTYHLNDYIDRYDELIRYQDELLGALFEELDLEKTIVVLVADHGETFDERGPAFNLNHGTNVFEEQVGIPFILYGPGVPPGRFEPPVETVDLLPTLLELLEVPMPDGVEPEGQSLVPLLRSTETEKQRMLGFSSNRFRRSFQNFGYQLRSEGFMHSMRSERWKLIVYPGVQGDILELYDLQEDPGERNNVVDQHPGLSQRMRQVLAAWQRPEPDAAPTVELSAEDLDALRALGYVDD